MRGTSAARDGAYASWTRTKQGVAWGTRTAVGTGGAQEGTSPSQAADPQETSGSKLFLITRVQKETPASGGGGHDDREIQLFGKKRAANMKTCTSKTKPRDLAIMTEAEQSERRGDHCIDRGSRKKTRLVAERAEARLLKG